MKKEYDFSRGKRGAVLPTAGKTRITIYLDDVILDRFKAECAGDSVGIAGLHDHMQLQRRARPIAKLSRRAAKT
jgi:hypothetical protein